MSNQVFAEIKVAAKEAPRMYFAPVVGVVRGVAAQYRALSRSRSTPQGTLKVAPQKKSEKVASD